MRVKEKKEKRKKNENSFVSVFCLLGSRTEGGEELAD